MFLVIRVAWEGWDCVNAWAEGETVRAEKSEKGYDRIYFGTQFQSRQPNTAGISMNFYYNSFCPEE